MLRPNVAPTLTTIKSRIISIRHALDRAILIDRHRLGYLNGVRRLKIIADKDVWNAEYDADNDTIILQRKVLALSWKERVRIILHEGGHRAQFNVDIETFASFVGDDLAKKEYFLAMANEVHMRQYELTGHVDDLAGEIFAESYARFSLEMPMPAELRQFWARHSSKQGE